MHPRHSCVPPRLPVGGGVVYGSISRFLHTWQYHLYLYTVEGWRCSVYVAYRISSRFIIYTTSASPCPPQRLLRDFRLDFHQAGVWPDVTSYYVSFNGVGKPTCRETNGWSVNRGRMRMTDRYILSGENHISHPIVSSIVV